MWWRPGIKNFQRRASEHGRYFFLLKRKLQKKVSTAASASERERPDVEIFIPGALRVKDVGSFNKSVYHDESHEDCAMKKKDYGFREKV